MTDHCYSLVVDDLDAVHRRHDRRIGMDQSEVPEDSKLEVSETASLAGPAARPCHGDTADNDQIEGFHLLELDRLPNLDGALGEHHVLERDAAIAQISGIKPHEGERLEEFRDRRVHGLAVLQSSEAHWRLRRVGIRLHDGGALPDVQSRQSFRCFVGIRIVGDAAGHGAHTRRCRL